MSSTFSLDLSTAQVGTALAENFVNLTGGISQQSVQNGRPPLLVLQNESGFGLNVVIQGWGLTFQLPAGGWTDPIPLPVTATGLSVTPLYAITGGGVAKLLGTIYGQNDPVVPVRTLGNSPVGGSVTVMPTSASDVLKQVLSDGVITGLVASKDVSVANQLDVTSGTAVIQQASGLVVLVSPSATTFLTSVPSSTYYLDLNSDGSYAFGTSHSTDPNAMFLWIVATDGSGNISTVTAQPAYNTINLLPNATGTVQLGAGVGSTVAIGAPLNLEAAVADVGGVATAGAFGVPFVVSTTGISPLHATSTGLLTVLTYNAPATPTRQIYRISGFVRVNNGTSGNNCTAKATYFDPDKVGGTSDFSYMVGVNGSSGAGVQFGGASSVSNNPWAFEPQTVVHTGGKAITIQYQDPTNTPNDFVSAIIERIG